MSTAQSKLCAATTLRTALQRPDQITALFTTQRSLTLQLHIIEAYNVFNAALPSSPEDSNAIAGLNLCTRTFLATVHDVTSSVFRLRQECGVEPTLSIAEVLNLASVALKRAYQLCAAWVLLAVEATNSNDTVLALYEGAFCLHAALLKCRSSHGSSSASKIPPVLTINDLWIAYANTAAAGQVDSKAVMKFQTAVLQPLLASPRCYPVVTPAKTYAKEVLQGGTVIYGAIVPTAADQLTRGAQSVKASLTFSSRLLKAAAHMNSPASQATEGDRKSADNVSGGSGSTSAEAVVPYTVLEGLLLADGILSDALGRAQREIREELFELPDLASDDGRKSQNVALLIEEETVPVPPVMYNPAFVHTILVALDTNNRHLQTEMIKMVMGETLQMLLVEYGGYLVRQSQDASFSPAVNAVAYSSIATLIDGFQSRGPEGVPALLLFKLRVMAGSIAEMAAEHAGGWAFQQWALFFPDPLVFMLATPRANGDKTPFAAALCEDLIGPLLKAAGSLRLHPHTFAALVPGIVSALIHSMFSFLSLNKLKFTKAGAFQLKQDLAYIQHWLSTSTFVTAENRSCVDALPVFSTYDAILQCLSTGVREQDHYRIPSLKTVWLPLLSSKHQEWQVPA